MKQAFAMMAVALLLLELGGAAFGAARMLLVVYGALALMAALIAATFLWLWLERATPLALGMVLTWTGGAAIAGWWWIYKLSGEANWTLVPHGAVLVQALYVVGASLHFAVIQRSFGFHGARFLVPVAGALLFAALVTGLV